MIDLSVRVIDLAFALVPAAGVAVYLARRNKRRLEAMMEAMLAGSGGHFVYQDAQFRVRAVSPAFLNVLSDLRKPADGTHDIVDALPLLNKAEVIEARKAYQKTGENQPLRWQLRLSDGSTGLFAVTTVTAPANPLGLTYLATFHDVSEVEMLRAEQSTRAHRISRMNGYLSHELAGPVGMSASYLSALIEDSENGTPLPLDEVKLVRDRLSKIKRTADTLLDYARAAAFRASSETTTLTRLSSALHDAMDPNCGATAFSVMTPDQRQRFMIDRGLVARVINSVIASVNGAKPKRGKSCLIELGLNGGHLEVKITAPDVTPDPALIAELENPYTPTTQESLPSRRFDLEIGRFIAARLQATIHASAVATGGLRVLIRFPAAVDQAATVETASTNTNSN